MNIFHFQEDKMSEQNFEELIHNLGNILFSVSGLILSKKFDEAKIKLSSIFGPIKISDYDNFKPIDLLFRAKVNLMKKYGINFSIEKMKFPEIDDADLCIIFGNILDNCINFSINSLEKFISIKFKVQNGCYVYLFSNSFSYAKCDKISQYEINGKIGLKTLRKFMRKNSGNLKFWIDKNIFHLEISIGINKIIGYER